MTNPFASHVAMHLESYGPGWSRYTLTVIPDIHMNPNGVVHGAVLYGLADTGMGSALFPLLEENQWCATLEIKMNYFRPAMEGELICDTELVNKSRTLANLESRVRLNDKLIAQANGNYVIR